MENALYFDIETIPGQRPGLREEIAKTITAPGQYKKPESIAEWERENKAAAIEEAWLKTSLNGTSGEVVVASFAVGDGEVVTITTEDWQDPGSEAKMLRALNEAISDCVPAAHIVGMAVVGHYVSGFDLRFIAQRSIICGVRPHPILARAALAKPWESDKVFDTMVQWAGVGNSISLDKLCKALGLPGKGAMDGSMVWPAVRDGRIAEVTAYCPDDVRKVRSVHHRMTFKTMPQPITRVVHAPSAQSVTARIPETLDF